MAYSRNCQTPGVSPAEPRKYPFDLSPFGLYGAKVFRHGAGVEPGPDPNPLAHSDPAFEKCLSGSCESLNDDGCIVAPN